MNTTEFLVQAESERREIVEMARDFAQTEIAPTAAERDRTKAPPVEEFRKLGELGFFGMLIPEQYEGLGFDSLTYLMVIEELAAADASVAITISVHNSLPTAMLLGRGSDEQKGHWLPKMARGETIAAFALSEADAGSDAASLRTQALQDGSDWILTGTKAWVSHGDSAGLLLVMARTDKPEERRGAKGISAFLVPHGTAGVEIGKAEDKMGLRSSQTVSIGLNEVRLGPEHLIGAEGSGFVYAMEALDQGRLGVAAQAVGIARAALEHSLRYSRERKQFDTAIKDFQSIQFKLADMATRVAAGRALMYEAARQKDTGRDVTELAGMAKLYSSEMAMWVTTQAVQIFGGYGYMRDYPVERLFRDAKVTEIYEGTSEIQRIVIGRGLHAE
jgi:alkylation response protein AidB-like acyl-CoA dehydrogenase